MICDIIITTSQPKTQNKSIPLKEKEGTPSHQPGAAPADNALATAEALKEQGNALFEGRRYREAMNLYSKVTLATAAHMRRVVPSDCPPPTRRS